MIAKITNREAAVELNVLFLSAQNERSVEENFNISFSETLYYRNQT